VDNRRCCKTWEERYDELKMFKECYGHVIVPQNHSSLGWWVNTQRKEYKKLKLSKKSLLTTERVLKLVDVEFCFDASGHKGGGSNTPTYLLASAATTSTMAQPPMLEQIQQQYTPHHPQQQHHDLQHQHQHEHQHHSIVGCGDVHLNPSVHHMDPNIQQQQEQQQQQQEQQHHHHQLSMCVNNGGIQEVSPSPTPDMTNRVDVQLI